MSSGSRLAKNTLYLTAASIAQKVIAFVYFTMIARFVGVEDTGAYFLSLAIVTVIMVLDDVGITSVVIREVAKKSKDALLWCRSVVGIKLITMPITVVVAFFVPILLGYGDDITLLVRIAVIIMLADTLSLSFYGILRGLHTLKYESLGIFIGQLLTAGLGITFMATGIATLPLLILALATGSIWNMLFSLSQVIRRLGWRALIPTYQFGLKPLKMAFAFFLAAAFVKIYSYVDSLILAAQIGKEAVGIYAVAYKLTYAFQFLPLAFVAALYPTMSTHARNPRKLKKILLDSFWYLMLLGAPIVFGIWSLAPEIVHAFYGADFIGSVLPLQVLIFVLIFIFLDFPVGSLLNATDRQSTKTGIMGGTMVINISANFILIPIYGVLGATLAALLSFVFLFSAGWFFAKKVVKINLRDLIEKIWRILASAAFMALIVTIIKPYVHFALAIPVGAICYLAAIFLLGAVRLDHIREFYRLLRGREYVEHTASDA